jgi:hypothetical protein
MRNLNEDKQAVYDDYRVKIGDVEQVSAFSRLKSQIQEDQELIEYDLVDDLLIILASHRTHMLDRIDEAIQNY